jgi:ATP/maltotriose-dependent transcriptional regulator MalT
LLRADKAGGALAVLQYIQTFLGRAKFLAGDAAGAIELLDSKEEAGELRRSQVHSQRAIWLAEAMVACGSSEEAGKILDRIELEMEERGEGGNLAHCWALKGRIALSHGDLGQAEEWLRRSLTQARRLSMRPVCEACEAELAAIAALRNGASATRTITVAER